MSTRTNSNAPRQPARALHPAPRTHAHHHAKGYRTYPANTSETSSSNEQDVDVFGRQSRASASGHCGVYGKPVQIHWHQSTKHREICIHEAPINSIAWTAFQLLAALRDARYSKLSDEDSKYENIRVASWNWPYLTDLASYKPTFLPLDDLADFSFFFDTSGRRTCHVAPKWFNTEGAALDPAKKRRNRDGCVIAELFREGVPSFRLNQLFLYRRGELSVDGTSGTIEDEGVRVRVMIKQMINLDPREGQGVSSQNASTLSCVPSINDLPCPSPHSSSSAHPQRSVLDVFLLLSPHPIDEAKLDCMVQYMMDLLHDGESSYMTSVTTVNFVTVMVVSLWPTSCHESSIAGIVLSRMCAMRGRASGG
ncbi:hypothetical protein FIBSPDRAFT_962992 [Athelia psychrophila]|uniref:Uncharacterized protein n=1 Tax=Athelia psychrophila TaxID=1759441 RepID=A0A165ZH91_9AGAM|nr:hypothetical protein FIBSPDRAFT_962992 [Fibularhizoctonia sp. CBS 109695]